ncbi:MAG: cytochrome c oxidase assembly protein [Micavibrio sp.]|nr:cytochrome c oxidase assembly protein [Micavibrio sp.]
MDDMQRKNRKVMRITLGVVGVMIVMSFLSAPLYRLTCKVTGWGGTTQTAEKTTQHKEINREITIRFNADVNPALKWAFGPEQGPMTLKIGADGYASFYAENKTNETVTGSAIYNVTPLQAGKYFFKTQCFCFGQQTLKPHEKVHMPVVFYVDPKIVDDPDMADVKTITLSYTFFREDTPELEQAIAKFENTPDDKPKAIN